MVRRGCAVTQLALLVLAPAEEPPGRPATAGVTPPGGDGGPVGGGPDASGHVAVGVGATVPQLAMVVQAPAEQPSGRPEGAGVAEPGAHRGPVRGVAHD